MNRYFFQLLIFLFVSIYSVNAQDIKSARKIINTLCSPEFHGRGYVAKGDSIAAMYLLKHFKKYKLKSFGNTYVQDYAFPVNTFPEKILVVLNDKDSLIPGYDYLIPANSNSISGTFPVIKMDAALLDYPEKLNKITNDSIAKSFILIDTLGMKNKGFKDAYNDIIRYNLLGAMGIIQIEYKNLLYVPSSFVQDFPIVKISRQALPDSIYQIHLHIKNKFIPQYHTRNLIAYIPGQIDSFLVFTAHYDHLGEMGKGVYFPGANDNGSGVSMVLALSKHFAKLHKPPKYSIVFMLFSGEEMGLLGSSYYVEHPLFPLSKIKFLVNLDVIGSGEKGIKVVNGTVFKAQFDTLVSINKEKGYVSSVNIRGPAANSDHYPFYEKGVSSFFIYTLGDYSEYHNIFDKADAVPLTEFEDLYRLLLDFVQTF
ncbi:MAG: M28 family peptidase [Bacteroidales bacterium]|nr:M28 family peptidase [Bacteroidales bacterium]